MSSHSAVKLGVSAAACCSRSALLHSEVVSCQTSVVDVENQAGVVNGGVEHLRHVYKRKSWLDCELWTGVGSWGYTGTEELTEAVQSESTRTNSLGLVQQLTCMSVQIHILISSSLQVLEGGGDSMDGQTKSNFTFALH